MEKKPKLGSGKRFARLKAALAHKPGIKDPGAVAAYAHVYKNNVDFASIVFTDSASGEGTMSYDMELLANDVIDIRGASSYTFGGGSLIGNGTTSKICI